MTLRPSRQTESNPGGSSRNLLRRVIDSVSGGHLSAAKSDSAAPVARRGQLLLESLEQRQLMAGDMDLLFTDPSADTTNSGTTNSGTTNSGTTNSVAQQSSTGLQLEGTGEGEAAPDLVQFAEDLEQLGVVFYGAEWCPACTQQKELFSDGKDNLPFIEVTNPDRSFNSIGQAEGISTIPTWDFPNGTRLTGVQTLETLAQTAGISIPSSDNPTFEPIGDLTVGIGSPLHVPIDAYDPGDGPLTTTVTVGDPSLLEATVLSGNRSIRVDLTGYGDMVFELFEQRAPVASGRVAELANEGFYDGIIFHRVVDNFVLQAGDPTGTGTSGSNRGTFDDDFHPDLQHNREGILSFAKTTDDTNNSQFFITETPTRFLDYNHSIFGQLVEGFDVREAISETAVNSSDRPINDVTIESVDVFNDTENSVVMLKPTGNATGTTTVTFTVTDADNNTFSETITVTVNNDTVNSQPYLDPIADPATTALNQNAQLQLSSVDIENDAVTYFATSQNPSNAAVNVDSTTGLVTVTPATDFTGTVNVQVGVRPGPGVTGNSASDSDTQLVSFEFAGEGVITPSALDLLASSDTGASSTDNITNAGSLTFQVDGVVAGQTIEVVNTVNSSVIGTGVATGNTITITTNNIAALGDGTYSLAARARLGNDVSTNSSAISLVYDSTQPDSVVSSAVTNANVGRNYISNLISPEEGSGLIYQLSSAPTGASIDSTTGVINWTPTQAQLGSNAFAIQLTDPAGNVRSESFNVTVAGEPLAEVRLEATDLQGNVLTSLAVGQEFLLNFIGVDARLFSSPGVFAAYADILFDSSLIQPVSGAPIDYSDGFTVVPKGAFSDGLIDELGAVSNRTAATNEDESLIATVRMEAIAAGTVNILSEPADESNSEFLLFGNDNQIPAESVAYGNLTLNIGTSFTLVADTLTVAEDSGATTVDVLANDTITSGSGQLSVVSVTQPTSGGVVSLSGGSVAFTPTADFFGDAVFTYRASDSSGIQEDQSVTVTVTPVNDPPTGVSDTLTVNQNSTNNTLNVLANDSIAPDTGETLTIQSVGSTSAGGTVIVATDGGTLIYTPATDFVGSETFSYVVSDGTTTTSVNVTMTVATADNPPTAVNDSFSIAEDDAEATFDVLSNDTGDADNETFVLDSVGVPSQGGSARVSSDGTQFFYTPAADFNGTELVSYTIRDSGGGISVGTVTMTVAAVNDAPPAANLTAGLNRGDGETVVLDLNDVVNVDAGETLSIPTFDSTTTEGGSVRIDTASGRLLYTPPSTSFTGTDSFSYSLSDGTSSASATITIEVSDFTARTITYQFQTAAQSLHSGGIRLVGNDENGSAVDVAPVIDGTSVTFPDLLPGDYAIEVPAIPFLRNGDQPQRIEIDSNPADGDTTIQSDLGLLLPEYISILDFLRSTPQQQLLVAVSPGEESVMTTARIGTNTINNPVASLDSGGNNLTIRGTQTDETTQEETPVEVTLPAVDDGRVQLRGEVDGLRLYRVSVEEADVSFTSTTVSTTGTTQSASSAAVAAVSTTPASADVGSSNLTLDSSAAEAEAVSSAAVARVDVLSPSAADETLPLTSSSIVLSTEDGDVWQDDVSTIVPSQQSKASGGTASDIDTAMQNVTESLTLTTPTEDTLSNPTSLDEAGVDSALQGGL